MDIGKREAHYGGNPIHAGGICLADKASPTGSYLGQGCIDNAMLK